MVDRMRGMFRARGIEWIIDTRDPVGYFESLNMMGPADQYMYTREQTTPPQVEILARTMVEGISRGC
jgi:hypothetical protein